jgi:transposase
MASLTRKIINGRAYYYIRECGWVNGKPKIVHQQYVGPVKEVVARLQKNCSPDRPSKIKSYEFGAVAALWSLVSELKLVELIDRHVKRKTRGGISVGTYLVLAALNRCIRPSSKARMLKWYQSTVLPRLVPIAPRQLTSQRFWDKMNCVSTKALSAIDRELAQILVKDYQVDSSLLFYDATNFFTFIDTFNTRSDLAQRGHCKYGRNNLRILGLSLLVSREDHMPLLYHLYPGNQHDAVTFRSLLDEIVARYSTFSEGAKDVTVVFDKGNNAADIIQKLDGETRYHFVGSLVPTQHPELLKIRREDMRRLDPKRLPGVRAFRTKETAFGAERTVVVSFNPALFKAQTKTLTREMTKRLKKLRRLAAGLERWRRGGGRGKSPTAKGVRKKVSAILAGRHMKDLLKVTVSDSPTGIPVVEYELHAENWENLKNTLLGKTLIFTDHDDWSDEDIVEAYRGQANVEAAFREMKDVQYVAFRPTFHWTDQKVHVHAFYCVLALILCSFLRRKLRLAGLPMSIASLMGTLKGIREAVLVYPARRGKGRVEYKIEDMDADQQRVYDALMLARHTTR